MRASAAPAQITPAIVLRLVNYGESDRIVTLLTASSGKISALAKGARSSRKRFGAALAPFGFGEAMLRERKGQDLWLLEELHTSRGFSRLGLELGRFGHASYACELCLNLCPPHEPEPQVMALLYALLDGLDRLPLSSRPAPEPLRVFELQLLRAVGLGLSLDTCAACGDEVPEAEYVPIDLARGGVICTASCWHGPIPMHIGQHGGGISRAVRAALQTLDAQTLGSESLSTLSLPRSIQAACRELLVMIVQHHLGKRMRTVEFIAKLNAMSLDAPA